MIEVVASIAIILPGFPRSPIGGYKVAYQKANFLAKRGNSVAIFHMRIGRDGQAGRPREAFIAAAYLIGRRRRPKWFDLTRKVKVRNYGNLRERHIPRCDIVIATSVRTADLVSRLTVNKCKGIYLIQHFEDFTVPADEVLRTWRLPMRRVVVSKWLQTIASENGLTTTLIENGVDTDYFRPGAPTRDRTSSVLAMVSNQAWKRTDLVEALMRATAEERPEVTLRTFGTCPRPVGLPDTAVHFENPTRDQLIELYRDAQVFVCSSDFEGFGLPALEAMACGCAVVSTQNGGVPAFAGDAAIYVERGDSGKLIAAVNRLLDDSGLRARLVSDSRLKVEELSLQASCEAFEEVVRDVARQ
jgi:glycosyltransferase involved in cell wall biosynthesis